MKVFGTERSIDIAPEVFPNDQELEGLEGESVMPGCEHGWYPSVYEAAQLHYRYFLPKDGKTPKAILVYQHGIMTHGGKAVILEDANTGAREKFNMPLLSDTCLKEEIAVYAPDMYGHGYSEGTRFWIPETWQNNLQDLLNFMTLVGNKHEGVPLFLMGESYGGTLAIHAARYFQDHPETAPKSFKGILLTGPAIIGDLPVYPVYLLLRYVLAPAFPKRTPFFMPNTLPPERIWRDPKVLLVHTDKRRQEMDLDGSGRKFRLGTAANLVVALEVCRTEAIPGFKQPFCLVHGTQDMGVPIEGSDYMDQTAATPAEDKAYLKIEGAYHDLLGDPSAKEGLQYFIDFMKKQISK